MIEIVLKNKELLKVNNAHEIPNSKLDFHVMQFVGYKDSELKWLEENYGLDFTIMKNYEDIEISSHFIENENQASFHFSIPYLNQDKTMNEEPVFIMITKDGLFIFSTSKLNEFFNKTYSNRIQASPNTENLDELFIFQFEFISDYFADITEGITKKIKALANKILIDKEFSTEELDTITIHNFSNLLIKETLLEASRVFKMYLKSNWEKKTGIRQSIQRELNDLIAVSDYIQFNFDRLRDLKENISNKIDLEQNHIFKMLTVVTVSVSLPTLIAGIYGMNFEIMPELKWVYAYPVVLFLMLLSALVPYVYFKRKKWLK